MNFLTKIILIFLIIFLLNFVFSYEIGEPIVLDNIKGTEENPYVIEGYEITNPTGDCIKITNCEHIIIKDNYLHDCGTDKDFQERTDHYQEGYAILIGNSSNILFKDNILKNNFRGFMAYNTPFLTATKNKITNTFHYSSLWCERCSNSTFSYNYLSDNGTPEHFWVPSDRSIGLWIKRSDYVNIHNNTIIRSTSDGIAVTGHIYTPSFTASKDPNKSDNQADWSGLSSNINIYDNLILDNMEQGIWLVNARNVKAYNNTIRTGCFTYGAGISTEFNVGDSEFYNNKFLGCLVGGVGGANSFNISVHDNFFYSWNNDKIKYSNFSNDMDVAELGKRQGANYEESHSNIDENNVTILIGGKLVQEMNEKLSYAEENKTYEAKGWMACEREGGIIDEKCVEEETSKGNQGVPREQLYYSSLMENFDDFVVEEVEVVKKDKDKEIIEEKQEETFSQKDNDSIIEELIESWEATLIALFIIILIIFFIIYKKRKRKNI